VFIFKDNEKNSKTYSTNSKNNDKVDSYAYENVKKNESNSNTSVNNLRNNLSLDIDRGNSNFYLTH
jgi:hypothetical protein